MSLNVGKKSPIVVLATINGNDSSITGFIREGDCSCKPIVARRFKGFNTDRYKKSRLSICDIINPMRRILHGLVALMLIITCTPLLGRSATPPADQTEQVRSFTRSIEYNFISWELNAIWVKLTQAALDLPGYMNASQQHDLVVLYLDLLNQTDQLNAKITRIYADPTVSDPARASQVFNLELSLVSARLSQVAPLAETILQTQVESIAAQMGVSVGGETIPPVSYHSTDPPLALIISPRNAIRQTANISLLPDMTAAQQDALEKAVSSKLNVSALVVGIGGIGLYPTMVMNTTDLNWLAETVSHEWTHNFLTWHPLGVSYDNSDILRTLNETVASLSGREMGTALIERFYPERVPLPQPPQPATPQPTAPAAQPTFSFNTEMHTTRVTTDQLLAAGQIDQAEQYMEARRQFLWDHGYQIRKLNQAYFAFYGAYNDVGGGAAGQAGNDPVGPAVAALRAKNPTLGSFLNQVAWMTSLTELVQAAK